MFNARAEHKGSLLRLRKIKALFIVVRIYLDKLRLKTFEQCKKNNKIIILLN